MSGAVRDGAVLVAAALLGSIPFGLFVARLWSGSDVRTVGSGNIGATNVLRASGPAAGILTLALDIAKGACAVALGRLVEGADPRAGAFPAVGEGLLPAGTLGQWAALAAVAGHMFSPWLRFRGGKGVATALGALAVLSPTLAGTALAVFALVVGVWRIVSLASIAACAAMMILSLLDIAGSGRSAPTIVTIGLLIILQHRSNIARLAAGAEPRFGSKGRQP